LNLRPLKHFCYGHPVYGLNIPAERYVGSGVRFLRTTDVGNDGRLVPEGAGVFLVKDEVPTEYILRDGDLLFSRSGTLGRSLLFREQQVPTTHAGYLVRFRPEKDNYSPYLAYCAQSHLMQDAVGADAIESTIGNFNAEKYANVRLPWWPLHAQRAIADYLDRETARIDALIAAKRRMVELLEERKGGLREHLVSESWGFGGGMRLGHLLREVDDRLGDRNPLPLLSVSIHRGVIPFAEANPDREPRADDLINYKCCHADDVVLNRMRAFQGGIGRAPVQGIVSPDYAVLRPLRGAVSAYLNHLLRSPWFVSEMEARLRGIGSSDQGNVRTPRVNWDDLRTVVVPAPPAEEQSRLAKELDISLVGVVAMQSTLGRQIDLIQERRQALITAAVTGQLAIPEAA
jgi:type I restriction enzyme S subunit